MTISVTLQVPPSVYRLAQKTAEATSRPIEQVLTDVLSAVSPVSDDLPPELQAEINALAQFDDDALRNAARSIFATDKRRKYDRLLEKNSAGTMTAVEREQLQELRLESERLMLRKAHAYALLKWRGHALPPLNKLPPLTAARLTVRNCQTNSVEKSILTSPAPQTLPRLSSPRAEATAGRGRGRR